MGIIGGDRFSIGRLKEGDSRDVNLTRQISPGVTELMIVEVDETDPDDCQPPRDSAKLKPNGWGARDQYQDPL